jgi:hypothetical protein
MKAIGALLLAIAFPAAALAGFGVEQLDRSVSKAGAASLSSPVSPSTGYEVSAQQGDSNVTLKISRSLMGSALKPTDREHEYTGSGWVWSVTAQAPLSKDGSTTTIGTLDGLSNSTTVEFKLTNVVVTGIRIDDKATKNYCNSVLLPKYLAADSRRKKDDFQCDSGFVKKYLPSDYREFREFGYAPTSEIYIWGLNAKGGYKDFDYFQSSDLSKQTVRKSPWSAGAFASYAPSSADTIFVGSFRLQEAYTDAKSNTLCPGTASSSGPIQCASGPIGLPSQKRKQLLTIEVRRRVSQDIAFSLSATRDFKNKLSGVQLPIYFVGNGDGGLTGGVRADWSSDTHKTTVGIFIGQAFQLFD